MPATRSNWVHNTAGGSRRIGISGYNCFARRRKTFTELVKKVAANISIPFTVGGGINELKDVDRLLSAGADKVSINSAALAIRN